MGHVEPPAATGEPAHDDGKPSSNPRTSGAPPPGETVDSREGRAAWMHTTLHLPDEGVWVTVLAVWSGRDDDGVWTAYARVRDSDVSDVNRR
jgi:hypothetical protein